MILHGAGHPSPAPKSRRGLRSQLDSQIGNLVPRCHYSMGRMPALLGMPQPPSLSYKSPTKISQNSRTSTPRLRSPNTPKWTSAFVHGKCASADHRSLLPKRIARSGKTSRTGGRIHGLGWNQAGPVPEPLHHAYPPQEKWRRGDSSEVCRHLRCNPRAGHANDGQYGCQSQACKPGRNSGDFRSGRLSDATPSRRSGA